jgi:hypothetical protein
MNVMKVAKVVVTVASVGVSLAASYFADKELDEKVAKKVADALAKTNEKES